MDMSEGQKTEDEDQEFIGKPEAEVAYKDIITLYNLMAQKPRLKFTLHPSHFLEDGLLQSSEK